MSSQPHANKRAFSITPFEKKNVKGKEIDFDHVRTTLIEPALDRLGLKGRSTLDAVKSGNVRADMFQRLLAADLVVAEVSISNANVFYELGVRHALRRQRTFMLRRGGEEGDPVPFDLRTDRYLTCDHEDPARPLDELVTALRATLDSGDQDSPVFDNLPGLREQERSHFQSAPREFRVEVERAKAAGLGALPRTGGTNLVLIALWNKEQGDGPGGTKDLIDQAEARGAGKRVAPKEGWFDLVGGPA